MRIIKGATFASTLCLWLMVTATVAQTPSDPLDRGGERAESSLPHYSDHLNLDYSLDSTGKRQAVRTPADWAKRRSHIRQHLQAVMGRLPADAQRVPLNVKTIEEVRLGTLIRRKLTYQSDARDRVPAFLFLPAHRPGQRLPAVLCLQQTTRAGKAEPAGLAGDPSLHYALHLARHGYVTLAPDYPSFGEHRYRFGPSSGYASGSMKAVWDNIRAVDLLHTLPMVDARRIGCLGHSLGGHNTMFTAAFEPRLKVLVSNCGFTSLQKDDVPSWTGPRYMPRIKTVYRNDAARVPFDFSEIIGCFAPRPFLASAAVGDRDFDVSGVKDCVRSARFVYKLMGAPANLEEHYFSGPHGFPTKARERAYAFLDKHLK